MFVLCLERIGHRISDAMVAGDWVPFKFHRGNGLVLCHMCFVNDLILVAEASQSQVNCFVDILHVFCACSAQKLT